MNTNPRNAQATGDEVFVVMPRSVQQLATMYGISLKTMYKWLAPFQSEIGERIGRLYNNAQITIIVGKLGLPWQTIRKVSPPDDESAG